MKISLIISTYNRPDALYLSILSALEQSVDLHEIIVADDGSSKETQNLIEKIEDSASIPIIHVWQEDKGFRKTSILNKGIRKSSGDYIVFIDGDIILHPDYLLSQQTFAKKNRCLQGSRVLLSPEKTEEIIQKAKIPAIKFWSKGIKNRLNTIHSLGLSKLVSYSNTDSKKARGCSMSYWKSDLVKTNGFNEDFVDWGREDNEITARMINNGIIPLIIKCSAVTYHLDHGMEFEKRDQSKLSKNDDLWKSIVAQKIKFCTNGLNSHK